MSDEPRRLSAVMLTDLVGYTALTQRDEKEALRLLEEHRETVRPVLKQFRGHEIKTIGDAFLVEFESALDATQCAIEIQRALHRPDRPGGVSAVPARIGIHVGDVVHRDRDVYGDAVNIVSRIEPLAEPGGVCLSQTVYDQVRNKIDLPLRKLEPQQLHNVLFPVEVYRVELPWSRAVGSASPWVGRVPELATFGRAFDRASRGTRSVVFVTGEEGIGKTRLVEEALRAARDRGFRVLRGRSVRTDLAAPYAPWSETIREFLRDAPNQLVYKALGNYANEIVKLVPDLGERLGPVTATPSSDADQARLRFFEGVVQFFANVAREGPTVVFLDDLQWADPASLRLFGYVARGLREAPIVLIAAFSTPEDGAEGPLADLVREARREQLAETLPLRRFGQEEVAELVGRTFGEEEISDEFRQLLSDRTGGNPFYLTETLRSLVDEGMIYRTPEGRWERKAIEDIRLPRTVRDAIRERFNRLDKGVQDTLRVASVLGTTFSSEVLRALCGVDEEVHIAQVESAVEAHILREEPAVRNELSLSFTDPHVRDVLYTEMLAIRRARYHRQAAETIERRAHGNTRAVAADLAHHYREGHDAAKALEYTVAAGDSDRNLFAYEEAEKQYRAALELLRDAPAPARSARVLASLGACHFALAHPELTVVEWESAIRQHVQAGEPVLAGALCDQLADLLRLRPNLVDDPDARIGAVLEEGRALLESVPPGRELALHYDMEAAWLASRLDLAAAREKIDRATALARQLGDVGLDMAMTDERVMVAPLAQRDTLVADLERKYAYFSRPETLDLVQVMWAASILATAHLGVRGDGAEGVRWAEREIEVARTMRNTGEEIRQVARDLLGALLWTGQLDRAEREVRRCEEFPGISAQDMQLLETALLRIDLARGDRDSASARVARHPDLLQEPTAIWNRAAALNLRASYRLLVGERASAVADLREVLAIYTRVADGALRASEYAGAAVRLAETLLDGPDANLSLEEVEQLLAAARTIGGRLDHAVGRALCRRLEARVAAQRSDPGALALLEQAAALLRTSGAPLELAATLRLLGRWYRRQGDGAKSGASFAEAIEVYLRAGAHAESRRTELEAGGLATLGEPGAVPEKG